VAYLVKFMAQEKCIICGSNIKSPLGGERLQIDCPVCGPYIASDSLWEDGAKGVRAPKARLFLLSAWVRQKYRSGEEPPLLLTTNFKEILDELPTYSPEERMERLLLVIGNMLKTPAATFEIPDLSPADAWAVDGGEMKNYLNWMDGDGITEKPGGGSARRLTRQGWKEFDRLSRRDRVNSRRAFVAMWFADEMDVPWTDGFKPAIEDAGFEAFRMKEDIHDERIDARLVAAIRESRFVVADVTGGRNAVYYEGGFADGLGKQVIWTCRKGNEADMSFDTRQYLHIVWDDPTDLRRKLVPVIRARII
jgi:hypothetical protein